MEPQRPSTPARKASEPPPTPTTPGPGSTSGTARRSIPRYTSIDLESDLPEIFSTNLNPNLHDPDMSNFYSHPNLGRYNYPYPKTGSGHRISPPPIYERSPGWSPPNSPKKFIDPKAGLGKSRHRIFWISFFFVFIIVPLVILIIFQIIPYILDGRNNRRVVD